MPNEISIRPVVADDIPAIGPIAEADLFPADILGDLLHPFFDDPDSQVWCAAERNGQVIGFAYAEPEPMTDRVWNLRAIAVVSSERGAGAGRALLQHVEAGFKDRARLVVIDTTQLEEQAVGRSMYQRCGYAQIATVLDFWEDGADKVTFCKKL